MGQEDKMTEQEKLRHCADKLEACGETVLAGMYRNHADQLDRIEAAKKRQAMLDKTFEGEK